MPISEPQTNSELPKNGASTRLAAISIPRDHRAGDEHGAGHRKPMPPSRHGDPLYSSYTATQGPASLPVAAW